MKSPQVPRLICLTLGLLGLGAYAIMALIDISYGQATAATDAGRAYQPFTMGIISAFGFAFTCGAGALYRSRRAFLAGLLFAVSISFMAYSALNGVGFFAGESIGKTRAAAEKAERTSKAVELANQLQTKQREETIAWLKSVEIKSRSSADKSKLIDKVAEMATAPVRIEVPEAAPVVADYRSEVMRRVLGWEIESAQVTNSVWVVALLLMGKLLGPSLMFALWPVKSPPENNEKTKPPNGGRESFASNLENGANAAFQAVVKLPRGPKKSPEDARKDIAELLRSQPRIQNASQLENRWNWPLPTVLRYLDKWENEGLLRTKREGRERVIMRAAPTLVRGAGN